MRDQRCSSDVAEEWRDIAGYEGLYQVSNFGMVRSLPKRAYKRGYMKQHVTHYGYLALRLTKNGKARGKRVHRLVAEAFLPNPNNYPVVNHIDGNKQNNVVSNLEWCTYAHNAKHAHETGLFDNAYEKRKKKVVRDDGAVFNSVKEAAESLGVKPSKISECAKGKRKSVNDRSFFYCEEETA